MSITGSERRFQVIKPRGGWKLSEETKAKMRLAKSRSKNPNWKGNAVGINAARNRAERWFSVAGKVCDNCGGKRIERHHKDGDPLNNSAGNIAFLCRGCHMEADGRLEEMRRRNKTAIYGLAASNKGRTLCIRGHPLYVFSPRGWRRCRECIRARGRRYYARKRERLGV